jgi:hypothetical protein
MQIQHVVAQCHKVNPRLLFNELAAKTECDLSEIREDNISPDEDEDDTESSAKVKKHHIQAASRNAVLLLIVHRIPLI